MTIQEQLEQKNFYRAFKHNVKETMVICDRCNGLGTYSYEELEDYHHREYRIISEPCSKCNGNGRYFEQTMTLKGIRQL